MQDIYLTQTVQFKDGSGYARFDGYDEDDTQINVTRYIADAGRVTLAQDSESVKAADVRSV